jgi:hypothetical protein
VGKGERKVQDWEKAEEKSAAHAQEMQQIHTTIAQEKKKKKKAKRNNSERTPSNGRRSIVPDRRH